MGTGLADAGITSDPAGFRCDPILGVMVQMNGGRCLVTSSPVLVLPVRQQTMTRVFMPRQAGQPLRILTGDCQSTKLSQIPGPLVPVRSSEPWLLNAPDGTCSSSTRASTRRRTCCRHPYTRRCPSSSSCRRRSRPRANRPKARDLAPWPAPAAPRGSTRSSASPEARGS